MHFGCNQQKIIFLEQQDVLLTDSFSSFEEVVWKEIEVPGNKRRTITNNLKTVIGKNTAYKSLKYNNNNTSHVNQFLV